MSKTYNDPKSNNSEITPDVMWNIIGDFWRLFDDKKVIEELWGGYSEIINQFYSALLQTKDSLNISTIPVFWECNWLRLGPMNKAEDCAGLLDHPSFTRRLKIDDDIVTIPSIYKTPNMKDTEAPRYLEENVNFVIRNGYLYFDGSLTVEGNYWAPVLKRNKNVVTRIFGAPLDIIDVTSEDYYSKIAAIWRALWHGPTVSVIESGVNAIMGYPYAQSDCTVTDVQDVLGVWAVSMSDGEIASSALRPLVVKGQKLSKFDPIFQAVQVEDRVNSPAWWVPNGKRVHIDSGQISLDSGQKVDNWIAFDTKFSGLAQFHLFKVKVAYDSLKNAGDDLKYTRYFLERIKPVYTSYILEVGTDISDVFSDDDNNVMPVDQYVEEVGVEPVEEYWPDIYIDIDTKKGLTGRTYGGL